MGCSHSAGFGMNMIFERSKLHKAWPVGRLARRTGLVAALGLSVGLSVLATAPGPVRAQVNIDQGKSAADIFANDCGVCHKSIRGLASGQNSLGLTSFLREHYTASQEQASALAAYVLGNGGGSAPAKRNAVSEPKPEPKTSEGRSTETKPSESKPSESKPAEAKLSEPRAAGAKSAARPARAAIKRDEEAPASRPQHPADDQPVTANRTAKPEPEIAPPGHEAPAAAPAPETPVTGVAAPSEPQPAEDTAVPRDEIPD